MSLRSERRQSSDKNESVFWLTDDEFEISPSNGSVRHPFKCQVVSQASDNFEPSLHSFKTGSSGESLRSMRSDYYVPSQESKKTSEKQIESLVSIGFVTLDESRQSSSGGPGQACERSEHKIQSLTGTIPDDTHEESVHDVKVKGRNFFREQLLKWNIIQDNQVRPSSEHVQTCMTKVIIDGETLVQVGRSKDLIYYYIENGLLAKGGYGSVYKGYAIKGTKKTPVAVKFLKYISVEEYCKDKDLGRVPSEVYFLKKMKGNPNVIRFLHYQRISADMFVIICERPLHCKDLFYLRSDRGGTFTEWETKRYVKALVNVVRTMERKNIVHRDLKLENILYDYDKDNIKLIDFGLATKHKPGKQFNEFAGTAMNVPPEYVIHGVYDPSKEAVRSIGVIIYQMLYGQAPYTNYKTFSDVTSGLPKFNNVSDELKHLLTKLYAMDPTNRPSIREVANHSWLQVTRSFTTRMSSFVRGFFRKRRGLYVVNHPKTRKESTTHLASRLPRTNQPANERAINGQSVNQLSNYRQTTSHVQLDNYSQHSYSERAIDIGNLTDHYHPVTNSYHAVANQDHPAAYYNPFVGNDDQLDSYSRHSYSERAIDIGNLADHYHTVTNSYHAVTNQDHPAANYNPFVANDDQLDSYDHSISYDHLINCDHSINGDHSMNYDQLGNHDHPTAISIAGYDDELAI